MVPKNIADNSNWESKELKRDYSSCAELRTKLKFKPSKGREDLVKTSQLGLYQDLGKDLDLQLRL